MPTYLQRIHSGRITKPSASTSSPTLNRSLSAPLNTAKSIQSGVAPLKRSQTVALRLNENHRDDEGNPPRSRTSTPVSTYKCAGDVTAAVLHALTTMFDDLPIRSGLDSVGISNVLNFRRGLPRIVTFSHLHALMSSSSSQTEREIQGLLASGELVKLRLVGRGNEISGLGEVLIRREDYHASLIENGIEPGTADAFMDSITPTSKDTTLPIQGLDQARINQLMRSGFLVSSGFSALKADAFSTSTSTSRNTSTITAATISKAASGTHDAVGGSAAFEFLGGNGTFHRSPSNSTQESNLLLSAPGLAAYLQLLTTSRTHLLNLLRKSGGIHKQMPVSLLRERWNGNVEDESARSVNRRNRGEFAGVLPARTRKWKMMYGLRFDWVLEECLGAGLVECWNTGAVGMGVRALV